MGGLQLGRQTAEDTVRALDLIGERQRAAQPQEGVVAVGVGEHGPGGDANAFLQGALVHPKIVGTHWFQFRDQPLTGRWDGEGYAIGFVDVADTPYPEMTKAARAVGEGMYRYRQRGKLGNSMR